MDSEVYKIILISRDANDKLTMKLDVDLLSSTLKPLGDLPVAIISIFGRSKSGKSLLMNYILRYLNNDLAFKLIEPNETLEGFDWGCKNTEYEQGIYISKPFIFKRDNKPEFALILMDNQWYFDKVLTKEDLSSIIGLNLITSSIAIYNDCNSIDEDMITALLPILEYETFVKKQGIVQNRKEFSKLIFLIRDWDNLCEHQYGFDGGKSFLDKSLHIGNDLSLPSQKARILIRKSFEGIFCFLLPHSREKFKNSELCGSANKLGKLFISNLNDFITKLLKDKILSPMRIQNVIMTSSVLTNYIESCVKLFNNGHIASPENVFILKSKFSNILRIYGLKEIYLTIVREKLKTTFVARTNLHLIHNDVKSEIVKIFDDIKSKFDKADTEEFNIIFEKVLKSCCDYLHEENKKKRNSIAVETIDKCIEKYHDKVSEIKISSFEDVFSLDDILSTIKTEVISIFNGIYENEEKELFSTYQVQLYENIEKAEKDFKSNNGKNFNELKLKIEHLIEQFKQTMLKEIDHSLFLTNEQFDVLLEKNILNNWKLFNENCKIGIFNIDSDFQIKLDAAKNEIHLYYENKCDQAKSTIVKEMNNGVNNYKLEMTKNLATFKAEEELLLLHSGLKDKISVQIISDFSNTYPNVDISFDLKELENKLNFELERFKSELSSLLEKQRKFFSKTTKESKELYRQGIGSLFKDNKTYTDESLNLFHIRFKEDALQYLKINTNYFNNTNLQKSFLLELDAKLNKTYDTIVEKNNLLLTNNEKEIESKINDLLLKYEEKMDKKCASVVSEEELLQSHEKLKNKIIMEFNNTIISLVITKPEFYFEKLEKELENSKKDIFELFGFKFSRFVNGCRKFYKDEMSKIFKNEPFLSSKNLQTLHHKVISKAVMKFENERENIPSSKFKEIINKYLSDIFNEFNEENNMNTPSLPAIGIDLGTTNSCVAYYKPGKMFSTIEVIPNDLGKNTTPSCVLISGFIDEVGINAKQRAYKNPRNTIFSIKRLIGRKFSDESVKNDIKYWPFDVIPDEKDEPMVQVVLNNKEKKYYPEQISAKVLSKMKQIAEIRLGLKVRNAVITVPAYFNEAQKEATKHAGKIAGLNVLKIITEPTASAIAFKSNRDNNIQILSRDKARRVLIYDLGGGTFDVAILKIDNGNIIIEAYGGNTHLGGDDFDDKIINYCIESFRHSSGLTISKNGVAGSKAMSRLRTICEEQKCNLSLSEKVNISADAIFQGKDLNVDLTRKKFEELNQHLFEETITIVDKTLKDKNINLDDINDVLLVGGSTRIPKVQELLTNYFKGKTLCRNVNPDEAVAVGAAIQAAILNGEQAQKMEKFTISEICPLSLGIFVHGGYMSVILPKNSAVPIKVSTGYQTSVKNQHEMIIRIFEGEEIMAESNRLLGKFLLSGIPPGEAGEQKVDVTFEMTDEAILHVVAKIRSTGSAKSIDIIEHKGRISDEVLQLLIEQEMLINSF